MTEHVLEMTSRLPWVARFLASLICFAGIAGAQANRSGGQASTGLLGAVLGYRLQVVESATPIDACSVYKLMDSPRDFPLRFAIAVQNLLDRHTDPCTPIERPPAAFDSLNPPTMRNLNMIPKEPGSVMIDSVRRVDSLATVYASVRRNGDAVHSEEFKAVYQVARKEWLVKEVRLYGLWYPH